MSNTEISPKDWIFEFQQRGGNPLLMSNFWCESLYFKYPKEIGLDVQGLDYLMTSENRGYYRFGQREVIFEKLKKRLGEDPEYIKYIFEKTKERVEEFASYMESKNKEFNVFVEKFLNLVPWFFIPWYITEFNILSDKILKELEKFQTEVSGITDLNNAAMILMFPDKKMEFQKEQSMFYNLVKQFKDGKKINSEDYLDRFSWMKTFILVPTEPLDEKGLMENINTAIKEKSDETYKLQQERRIKDKEVVSKLEKIISGDKNLLENIKNARYLAWMLTWSVETSMKSFARGIPWYKEISKSIGVNYEDWVYLTISEVRESLKAGKSIVPKEEIVKRKKSYVLCMVNGETILIKGGEAEDFINKLNITKKSGIEEGIKEIVGKSAYNGKVTGRVKVCYTAVDSHSIEEGDILVTIMTTPDYVPAMKKAAAIVTDEGGLLCHAAIISREIGIPCIIGTKIATKVLKDGDLVEVDAEKGVVKILKE